MENNYNNSSNEEPMPSRPYKRSGLTKQEFNKKYYREHKREIYEIMYQQVLCQACNKEYSRHYLSKHRKSKKHIEKQSWLDHLKEVSEST